MSHSTKHTQNSSDGQEIAIFSSLILTAGSLLYSAEPATGPCCKVTLRRHPPSYFGIHFNNIARFAQVFQCGSFQGYLPSCRSLSLSLTLSPKIQLTVVQRGQHLSAQSRKGHVSADVYSSLTHCGLQLARTFLVRRWWERASGVRNTVLLLQLTSEQRAGFDLTPVLVKLGLI